MKRIINKITLAILSLFLFVSCEKDFLEIVNPNQESTLTFWQNNADLNSGLTTVYHALANDNVLGFTVESYRADIGYPGFNRLQSANVFYNQTFNDGENAIAGKWAGLYAMVFRANQVIDNGERLIGTYTDEETIEEATRIIAQARFLRGYAYFTLYNLFNNGSVIIFDFVPEDESEFFQSLSSREEVSSFYLNDLEYARENLPPSWPENFDRGRVTAGTATAVLGKHYLYEGNYSEKADAQGFSIANVSNRHNKSVAPAGGPGGFRTILPSAWLAIAYANDAVDTVDPRNQVDSLDIGGRPVLDDQGNTIPVIRQFTLRTSASVALVEDFRTPYYQADFAAISAPFNNAEYSYYRKYSNWRTVTSETDFQPDFKSPLNVRLIRLADVYLMLAECLIQGGSNDGGVDDAMVLINRIRRRAGARLIGPNGSGEFSSNDHDDITYNAQSLMEHLMYIERPLELSIEGQAIRFLDLRRWGILRERFNDLSQRDYYRRDFQIINADGMMQTKDFGSRIFEGIDPDTGEAEGVIRDNLRASENYNPAIHDYYPIPISEKTSNPNVN